MKDFDGILNIRTVNAFAVQGQSYARNYAVAESSADFILFCDADDIVSSGWVEAHFRQFNELSADITTGPAYNFIQYSDLDDYILPVEDYEGMQILENESKRYFPIIGCNFGIRKEKFILSGGFDESLLGGGEDIDLGIRVQKLGVKVSKARNAFIFKKERGNLKSIAKQNFYYGKRNVLLVDRYGKSAPVSYSLKYSLIHIFKDSLDLCLSGNDILRQRDKVFRISGNLGAVAGFLQYKILKRIPQFKLRFVES